MLCDNIASESVVKMITHVCWDSRKRSEELLGLVCEKMYSMPVESSATLQSTFCKLLSIEDNFTEFRLEFGISRLLSSTWKKHVYSVVHAVRFLQTSLLQKATPWLCMHMDSWVEELLFSESEEVFTRLALLL